jgi:hypothetical protein
MTEEEKAIIELVGPAEKFDFEISTPPGFHLIYLSNLLADPIILMLSLCKRLR